MYPWLTAFGLGLDIFGFLVLVWGTLSRAASSIRHLGKPPFSETSKGWARVPVWLALKFGSLDVRDTLPTIVGELRTTFWGLVLVGFGFVFQAIGPLLIALRILEPVTG